MAKQTTICSVLVFAEFLVHVAVLLCRVKGCEHSKLVAMVRDGMQHTAVSSSHQLAKSCLLCADSEHA